MQPLKSVWVLEDDDGVQFVYREMLSDLYDLKQFINLKSLKEEMANLKENSPSLLIADLRLSGENFLQYLSEIKSGGVNFSIPFIVVSSVDDMEALRTCFRYGAKDYLTKPFSETELLLKIEKLIDAKPFSQLNLYEDLKFDSVSFTLLRNGVASPAFTAKEFQIFQLLCDTPSRRIAKQELFERIWGGVMVNIKTVDVHLFNLRKKLETVGLTLDFVSPDYYELVKINDFNAKIVVSTKN